jgi:hypothetical protein
MPAWFIDEHEVEVSRKSEHFCIDRTKFQKLEAMNRKSLKGRTDLLRNNRDYRVGGNGEGRNSLGNNEATRVAKKHEY